MLKNFWNFFRFSVLRGKIITDTSQGHCMQRDTFKRYNMERMDGTVYLGETWLSQPRNQVNIKDAKLTSTLDRMQRVFLLVTNKSEPSYKTDSSSEISYITPDQYSTNHQGHIHWRSSLTCIFHRKHSSFSPHRKHSSFSISHPQYLANGGHFTFAVNDTEILKFLSFKKLSLTQ